MGNYMAIICLNKEHELSLMSHELNIKLNMNENKKTIICKKYIPEVYYVKIKN